MNTPVPDSAEEVRRKIDRFTKTRILTAIEIIQMIAEKNQPAEVLHFLEVAPDDMIDAAAVFLVSVKTERDFLQPMIVFNNIPIDSEEEKRIGDELKKAYRQIYDLFFSQIDCNKKITEGSSDYNYSESIPPVPLRDLPLRALVSYASRSTRRVLSLFHLPDDIENRTKFYRQVSAAITLTEEFANTSDPTDELVQQVIIAGRHLHGVSSLCFSVGNSVFDHVKCNYKDAFAPTKTVYASCNTAFAAAHTALSRTESLYIASVHSIAAVAHVEGVAENALRAVKHVSEESLPSQLARLMQKDFDQLLQLSLSKFPDLGKPIDPSEAGPLGPLWEGDIPEWYIKGKQDFERVLAESID